MHESGVGRMGPEYRHLARIGVTPPEIELCRTGFVVGLEFEAAVFDSTIDEPPPAVVARAGQKNLHGISGGLAEPGDHFLHRALARVPYQLRLEPRLSESPGDVGGVTPDIGELRFLLILRVSDDERDIVASPRPNVRGCGEQASGRREQAATADTAERAPAGHHVEPARAVFSSPEWKPFVIGLPPEPWNARA